MLQDMSELMQLLNVLLIPMAVGVLKMQGRITSLEADVRWLVAQGRCTA